MSISPPVLKGNVAGWYRLAVEGIDVGLGRRSGRVERKELSAWGMSVDIIGVFAVARRPFFVLSHDLIGFGQGKLNWGYIPGRGDRGSYSPPDSLLYKHRIRQKFGSCPTRGLCRIDFQPSRYQFEW